LNHASSCLTTVFGPGKRTVHMCFVSRPGGQSRSMADPFLAVLSHPDLLLEGVLQPSQFVIRLLCHASKDAVAKDQSSTKPCAGDYTSSVVLVEWAMMCGLTPEMAFKVAIRDGHLEVVTFFISEYKWTEATPLVLDHHKCHVAASHGQLDCLKHLHKHGCEWDEWTCQAAAENGHLECLTYAHEHGCRWDEWTCHAAAKRGNHECLKYAHEHKCPWDEITCQVASQNGHIQCLKYAHEHGCPWDTWRNNVAGGRAQW
jgi:hypothetical protein